MVKDRSIDTLLKEYPVFEAGERGKLHCTLTNHDVPNTYDELKKYVETKKFQWQFELNKFMVNYGEHFDDIGQRLLGCKLTMKRVAKDPKDLQRHVEGKKFKRALARAEAAKEAEGEEDHEVPSAAQVQPTSSQDSSEAKVEDSGEDAVPGEEADEDVKAGKKRKLPAKAAGKKKSRRA